MARATSVQLLHMWGQAYSQLVRYNFEEPLEEVVPDLATSWEIAEDSKVYTFQAADGRPSGTHGSLTSPLKDARFAVQVLKDENPRLIPELESVTAIEAVGNDTLRISLSAPRASLVAVLGIIQAPIIAKHVWEAAAGDIADGPTVGTGPFLAGEYVRGESVDFTRFDGYYLEGKPYLDAIRYLMIGDESTRIAAFRTGRVDLLGPGVTDINKVQLAQLQGDVPDLSPNPYDRLSSKIVIINTDREPFTDVRVRRAIFLAIDRFEALEVLDDVTRPAGPAFAPGWELPEDELLSMPGYRQGAEKQKDLDEAKRLLTEAGFPDGFDTEAVTVGPVARLVKLQVFVVDQLAKVGIRVKSSPLPFPELVPRAVSNDFDLFPVESSVLYHRPRRQLLQHLGPTLLQRPGRRTDQRTLCPAAGRTRPHEAARVGLRDATPHARDARADSHRVGTGLLALSAENQGILPTPGRLAPRTAPGPRMDRRVTLPA